MKNNVISHCPSCGAELHISQLKCPECKIEISGDFDVPGSSSLNLSAEDLEFVKLFLKFAHTQINRNTELFIELCQYYFFFHLYLNDVK